MTFLNFAACWEFEVCGRKSLKLEGGELSLAGEVESVRFPKASGWSEASPCDSGASESLDTAHDATVKNRDDNARTVVSSSRPSAIFASRPCTPKGRQSFGMQRNQYFSS